MLWRAGVSPGGRSVGSPSFGTCVSAARHGYLAGRDRGRVGRQAISRGVAPLKSAGRESTGRLERPADAVTRRPHEQENRSCTSCCRHSEFSHARQHRPRAAHPDAEEDVPLPEEPQLPAVLHRPAGLEHGQLADQRRPHPAGAQDHRQRAGRRPAGRLPVRPDPVPVGVGRGHRRPDRQAAHAAADPEPGDGRVDRPGRPGVHAASAARRALRAGRSPAAPCWRSTTRCGARSSPRWCRPRTSPTPSCSTAPSSTSPASSGRRWPACWS